jgi:hypothetical protein
MLQHPLCRKTDVCTRHTGANAALVSPRLREVHDSRDGAAICLARDTTGPEAMGRKEGAYQEDDGADVGCGFRRKGRGAKNTSAESEKASRKSIEEELAEERLWNGQREEHKETVERREEGGEEGAGIKTVGA